MKSFSAVRAAVCRRVADALWSLRWAGVSLSGRAKVAFAATAVLLPVVAFGAVMAFAHRDAPVAPPVVAHAPTTEAEPPQLQRALDALGPVKHRPAVDAPKCRAATTRLKALTRGQTARSASKGDVEEVGFQAAVVGRFCDVKAAAKVNRDYLIPFYDTK